MWERVKNVYLRGNRENGDPIVLKCSLKYCNGVCRSNNGWDAVLRRCNPSVEAMLRPLLLESSGCHFKDMAAKSWFIGLMERSATSNVPSDLRSAMHSRRRVQRGLYTVTTITQTVPVICGTWTHSRVQLSKLPVLPPNGAPRGPQFEMSACSSSRGCRRSSASLESVTHHCRSLGWRIANHFYANKATVFYDSSK